jgi:hypothetical protein
MLAVPLKRKFTTTTTSTTTCMTDETLLSKRSRMWDEEVPNRNNKRTFPMDHQQQQYNHSPTKKAKTTTLTPVVFEKPLDEKELKSVVEKVVVWFSENSTTLPTTLQALHQTVRKFCNITTQIDPSIIFYHLLFNNVLVQASQTNDNENKETVDNANNINDIKKRRVVPNTSYNKNKPLLAFVLDGGEQRGFSEEFGIALRQSIAWVTTTNPTLLPSTIDGYIRQLEVICCFRRSVPPSSILSELERVGVVVHNIHDDRVSYVLPVYPNSCMMYPHYMPQLSLV